MKRLYAVSKRIPETGKQCLNNLFGMKTAISKTLETKYEFPLIIVRRGTNYVN